MKNLLVILGSLSLEPVNTAPVTIEPDIEGRLGKAWRCHLDELMAQNGVDPESFPGIARWIIEAPYAHPFWNSYSLGLIRLRPHAWSEEPPTIYLPGATHEILLSAVNPEGDRNRMILDCGLSLLTPHNFAAQLIEESDENAKARIEETVRLVCDGDLNPDSDFVGQWVARFGSNMMIQG